MAGVEFMLSEFKCSGARRATWRGRGLSDSAALDSRGIRVKYVVVAHRATSAARPRLLPRSLPPAQGDPLAAEGRSASRGRAVAGCGEVLPP